MSCDIAAAARLAARLHSKYNPQQEARRYIDALKIDNDVNCFILIEPGMGYMIPVLQKDRPGGRIVVLHADARFRELPGVFQADAAWYPDCETGVQEFLEAEVPRGAKAGIVEWRPALNVYGDKILALVRESAEFVKRMEAGRRTDAFFGRRWLRNFFRNLTVFQNTLMYGKTDIPVVITGSGPGLEAVITEILAARERVFVLAASSSLQALAAGGITPDMVIGTDGGGWALTHLYSFFRRPMPGRAIPALSLCAAVPSQCAAVPVLPMNDGSLWQSLALHAIGFPSVLIPGRGTVAASALELALELSDGPVFLAGMDLSVNDIRSHARPNGFDYLFFGAATRLRPVYTQYFIRSNGIKAGGSLDIYAAWFKSRIGGRPSARFGACAFPKRIFSLGQNHEVFNSLAPVNSLTGGVLKGGACYGGERNGNPPRLRFEPVKQADIPEGRARRAAEAVCAALGDPKYAPALAAELSPLLFPSRTDVPPEEIAEALRAIAGRYYERQA